MFGLLSCRLDICNPVFSQEDTQFVSIENALEALSELEKLLQEGANHYDNKDLMVLEEFDITKDLGAIVYPIKFDNKPCDFKKIKENIQIGFENLKCTQPNCNKTAKIYTMDSDDNPARLYCKGHSHINEDPKNEFYLKRLLFSQIGNLNYLERLLIVLQYEMEYLERILNKFIQQESKSYKEKIKNEKDNITNELKEMAVRSEKIICNIKGNEKPVDFNNLHSLNNYSKNCVQIVFEFLKLIYEINLKHKVGSEVNMILNLNKGLSQSENEKNNKYISIPDETYGEEIDLCKVPTQCLDSFQNCFNKLQSVTKNAIANRKRSDEMAKKISDIKEILTRGIKEKETANLEIKTQQLENNKKIEENSNKNTKREEKLNIDQMGEREEIKNQKESRTESINEENKHKERSNDNKSLNLWKIIVLFIILNIMLIYIMRNMFDNLNEIKPNSWPENIGPLSLRSEQFYRDNLEVTADFTKQFGIASNTYCKLGQFEYKQSDFLLQQIRFNKYTSKIGHKCFAVGQLEEGTNVLHGVGIFVCDSGDISEGYWEHGRRNGQGRYIWAGGDYYIGEFKEGLSHGQGTWYSKYGAVYQSGKWENDKFVG